MGKKKTAIKLKCEKKIFFNFLQICDGRALSLRSGASSRREKREDGLDSDLPEHVPEEFFRRYTDTDSRPLTPTPTSKYFCLNKISKMSL